MVPLFAVEDLQNLEGIGALWDLVISDGGSTADSKALDKPSSKLSPACQLAVNFLSQVYLSVVAKSLQFSCSSLTERCLQVPLVLLSL